MRRGYRLRCYPSPRQERLLARVFGISRWVWNHALEERTKAWRERHERVSTNAISRELTKLKRGEKPWLAEVASTIVTQSLRDQERAYVNFFEKRSGYPRFKKRQGPQSARYQLDPRHRKAWIAGERLVLSKLGALKVVWSRIPLGRPLMVTVSRDARGRYFVSFSIEEEMIPLPKATAAVGIDVGLSSAITLSGGRKVDAPRHLRKALGTVAYRSRVMARRKKGSKRRNRARLQLAKAHAKVKDSRQDWLHKLTSTLVHENQVLIVEDLNVAGMVQNHHLALSLSDGALSELHRQLEYKAAWYGRTFVRAGRFFPSSKKCSVCGFALEVLSLSEREWTCPECGSLHDRDVNAARNLLEEGLRILKVPPGGRELMRVEGGNPRLTCAGHSEKRESHEIEPRSFEQNAATRSHEHANSN